VTGVGLLRIAAQCATISTCC